MAFLFVDRLRKAAPSVELIDGSSVIAGCRMLKSPAELALMAQAKAMTLEVPRRASRILAEGISASAVRRFLDEPHSALGASASRFCLVQFVLPPPFHPALPA